MRAVLPPASPIDHAVWAPAFAGATGIYSAAVVSGALLPLP
jgi:hypothetical protein